MWTYIDIYYINDQYVELIRFFVLTLTMQKPVHYSWLSRYTRHRPNAPITMQGERESETERGVEEEGSKVYYWMHNGNASWQIGCFMDENRHALFLGFAKACFFAVVIHLFNMYNSKHCWKGHSFHTILQKSSIFFFYFFSLFLFL